ncbi:uncharacterized protein FIBRA_06244 [Fibroporia radiculosa]|uniref:Chitin synthase n=1 Tax=Fibroporia radiculosa TaxID=599839 RepID=J4GSE4_9APHY|nr:uncharacterized protein FIBRA_06244 [Fibroporia radiculosa]CCM04085.1 predicted protein [Fibroporia radiculosa]
MSGYHSSGLGSLFDQHDQTGGFQADHSTPRTSLTATAASSTARQHTTSSYEEEEEDDLDDTTETGPLLHQAPSRPGGHIAIDLGEDLVGGRIPQRTPAEYKTITRELVNGNLILDVPVPTQVSQYSSLTGQHEFDYMRYSAATCDPDDFKKSGFSLRQQLYDPPRVTELFIVITMYNEDQELLYRTLHGVFQNITNLNKRKDATWDDESWKKVVVCIVSDGRFKANVGSLCAIAALGAYQSAVPVTTVNDENVVAHIFEYSTQVPISVIAPTSTRDDEKGVPPIQIIFCLKEQNQKKINSHRWFFNAFGPILLPEVCVLLDVGTMPGPTSIYHLWKAFDMNPGVAGACGEIVAMKGTYGENLVNPLVAAQNFEYKMANILDKPLESVLGYITVLPGAFSAYRYTALQNDELGEGPLQKYFMGDLQAGQTTDIFTANMYLAEDRVLCWELVSKRKSAYILHYVKSAYAETDLPEFISQRRRWLNGSFFAAVHSIWHFNYIYRSTHTFARKFWIHVEMAYQLYNLLFSWFALGNYYIAFVILSTSLEFLAPSIGSFNVFLKYVYIGLLIMSFLLALGNKPQASRWMYMIAFLGFGCLTMASFIVAYQGLKFDGTDDGPLIVRIFTNSVARDIVISLLSTYGLYIISSLIALDPWHMVTSFVQYLLIAPSYIMILNVYAFANIHDISWGTKTEVVDKDPNQAVPGKNKNEVKLRLPTEKEELDRAYDDAIFVLKAKPIVVDQKPDPTHSEDFFKTIRTNVLLAWVLSNALLASTISSKIPTVESVQLGTDKNSSGYFTFILYSIAMLALIRFIGSSMYMFVWMFGNTAIEFLSSARA